MINTINNLGNGTVQAELASSGNGIELVDNSTVPGQLTVTSNVQSTAATDLGLIPAGEQTVTSSTNATASGVVSWGGANSSLLFQANEAGRGRQHVDRVRQ